MKVFEIRVLRVIFETKTDELVCEWRQLHNEELQIRSSRQIVLKCSNRGRRERKSM
jgi:hypothetical protein